MPRVLNFLAAVVKMERDVQQKLTFKIQREKRSYRILAEKEFAPPHRQWLVLVQSCWQAHSYTPLCILLMFRIKRPCSVMYFMSTSGLLQDWIIWFVYHLCLSVAFPLGLRFVSWTFLFSSAECSMISKENKNKQTALAISLATYRGGFNVFQLMGLSIEIFPDCFRTQSAGV